MRKAILSVVDLVSTRKDLFTEAGKYFVVGGVCSVLDFSLLFVLTHYLKVYYLLSSVASFMSASILNYYLCTVWIFKVRNVTNRNLEVLYYVIITAIGLGISSLFIWLFTSLLGVYFMLSKLFATFITYWWNFGARKYFLHNKTTEQAPATVVN